MRVNLEIKDADMTFPLHLFILRGRGYLLFTGISFHSLPCTSLDPNHRYSLTSFLFNSTSMEANRGKIVQMY